MKRRKVAKPWYQSRTLWVNAVAAGMVVLEARTDLLQPLLPVNFYAALAGLLPVVNAVLRCVTTQGIARNTPSATVRRSRTSKEAPIPATTKADSPPCPGQGARDG